MYRRLFLRAGAGITGTVAIAGCLSDVFNTRSAFAPPLVEDRPTAVYSPTHAEGMALIGLTRVADYTIALVYSYPHRFWTVTSDRRTKQRIRSEDSIHLMGQIWDTETRTVLPTANLGVEITADGEHVTSKHLWPMLSQNMGYHFGDNIALPGDGTYTITVQFGPVDIRRTGVFRDQFTRSITVPFEFDYRRQNREAIMFERRQKAAGKRSALEPMQMKQIPVAQLPPSSKVPGTHLGTATSGDGVFVVTRLDAPPNGIGTPGPYLAVSARTPYNRYPLPFMSLSATLTRGGTPVVDRSLVPTLDATLGYHYGTTVEQLQSGDTLALVVDTPPQCSRHEGYETAFLTMSPMTLTVP